jgi:hypothetical protein
MSDQRSVALAGTKLFVGDLGGEATERLAGIRKFTELPGGEPDEFETTEIDQEISEGVTDWRKKFDMGFEDGGNLGIEIGMRKSLVARFYQLKDRVERVWKIPFRDGSYIPFEGVLKRIKPVAQGNNEVIFQVTIRVTKGGDFVAGA